jgi:hypothetical protein
MDTRVDELAMHPTRHFDNPQEVLTYPGLKRKDRIRILESWKLDAQRLSDSSAENMTGGEETDLREVSKVLLHLKKLDTTPEAIQDPRGQAVTAGMAIGGLLGAGAGLVAGAATMTVSLGLVAQTAVVGLIVGGVAGALRAPQRSKEL